MFKIAIIGAGNIAPNHIEGLLTFPEQCHITAVVDIYPEKAENIKEKYNLDCKVFSSLTAMLESDVEVDIVHICTPPYTHAPLAMEAMNAKKNVLVEKPMATSLAECDEMLVCEAKNGVIMGCIAQNRFRNDVYKAKTILESGKAGKLLCAHVNSFWWRGHCYYDLWWRGTWEKEGGGCTLNHAVHHIDMINWLKGELPTEVSAVLANVAHDNAEVEDLSMTTLVYPESTIAQITASVVHHGEEQGLVLQCADAKLQVPWDCYASLSQQNGFPNRNVELEKELNEMYENLPDLAHEGHTGEIENYLTSLAEGKRPLIVGVDGRRTVELITAIYKSGFTKQTVTLPLQKDDVYYTTEGLLSNAPHFFEKTGSIENFGVQKITTGNYEKRQ